jgi:hypothetical protein
MAVLTIIILIEDKAVKLIRIKAKVEGIGAITIVQIKIPIIILHREEIIATNQEAHLVEIERRISKEMIEYSKINH